MSKRKHKKQAAELYENVTRIASRGHRTEGSADDGKNFVIDHTDEPIPDEILAASKDLSGVLQRPHELPKMKKFRFQLLHRWMLEHIASCRVADIGGGKGLLAYLLQQSGWQATVIDPLHQELPKKYKDLVIGKQIRIADTEHVPRLNRAFEPRLAQDFDLLVALHAHGCNIRIIDAAAKFGRRFIVLPCCIIHEPVYPPVGTHWLQCIADYATSRGFTVEPFRLNFKGQNIGLYARCPPI
jgi:hypothetical protein